jgi:Flp pilus assembly protein TadD
MKTETKILAKDFAMRTVEEPEAAAGRAGFLAMTGRATEARALVAEARKAATPPVTSFEVEAMLLDLEGKRDDARSALLKAEELGSANFFVHYRLATLTLPTTVDPPALAAANKRLRRAAELNDVHVPTLSLLANVLAQEGQGAEAVTFAAKAVRLEPGDTQTRLSLARGMWAAGRRDEATGHARAALTLAKSEEERNQVQELLAFFARSTPR